MGIYKMYSDADGETHIEEMDLARHPDLMNLQKVAGLKLQKAEEGRFSDFHTAPDCRWNIILSGQIEIGLGDGSHHRFGPGDIRFIEDVTGHGHTTRYVEPTIVAVMPLPDQGLR